MNIYSHGDFDGIVSAALVGSCLDARRTFFTSPKSIASQPVTEEDVVCDLPYPHRRIRLWFDHHEANIETVQNMGLADEIAGRFVPAPSAAQVVYDFFRAEHPFPEFIEDTVRHTNIIDSMDYAAVEDWLEPTPAHRINRALYQPNERFNEARRFMMLLVRTVARYPLEAIADSDEVEERYQVARKYEEESLEILRRVAKPLGPSGEILLLDLSEDRFAPRFSKNMAYTIHPEARAILQLSPGFRGRERVTEIRVSFSLNPFGGVAPGKNVAAILGELEVGSGHASAAGGNLAATSKEQLLSRKQEMLRRIADLWAAQTSPDEQAQTVPGR